MAPKIGACGAVAFVDEMIHHMTPLRGHRQVRGAHFAKYLQQEYPGGYAEGKFPNVAWRKWLEWASDSGFQTVSIPNATSEAGGALPIERASKVPLKRRMSVRASRNKLPPAVTGERRFFRTWVRAERKT